MSRPPKTVRAEGQTQISIALPVWLVDAIEEESAKENRNRSNWLCCVAIEKLKERGVTTENLTSCKRKRKSK